MEDNRILGKNPEDFKEEEGIQNSDTNETQTQSTETPEFSSNDEQQPGETREQYLDRLVGEGKKYRNTEELAKAYHNLNMFAETLKREKRDIENEYNKEKERAKTIEEIMDMINKEDTKDTPAEFTQEPQQNQPNESKEDIEQRIAQALEKKERENQRKETYERSLNKLKEKFGSEKKAFEYIQQYIGNDDTKKTVINQLGMTDPDGLVSLIRPYAEREQKGTTEGAFTPSGETSYRVNNETNSTSGLPVTWSQASKLRKEKPEVYYSGDFQSKLHRSANIAEAKGIDFFNT